MHYWGMQHLILLNFTLHSITKQYTQRRNDPQCSSEAGENTAPASYSDLLSTSGDSPREREKETSSTSPLYHLLFNSRMFNSTPDKFCSTAARHSHRFYFWGGAQQSPSSFVLAACKQRLPQRALMLQETMKGLVMFTQPAKIFLFEKSGGEQPLLVIKGCIKPNRSIKLIKK